MSHFLKAFIAISVLLNLLLAGIVVGDVGRYFVGSRKHYTMQEIAMALPTDKRERFEDTMEHAEQDTGELRQQLSDKRKKAISLLKAEPFDKAAYLAQMQEIHQLHGQIMQRMVEAVAGLAEQSTPEERATIADMLRRPPRSPSDD